MRTPSPSPFLGDDEDLDSWSEAHSAQISRVDLVGRPANGAPGFLLMKSQGGLLPPDEIRALITKSSSTESTVTNPKIYRYTQNGTRVLSRRALTVSEVRTAATALRKAAAKGKRVAVYDAAGNLVGTVDECKIEVTESATPADAPAAAPVAAPVKAAPAPAPAPQAPLPGDAPAAPIVQPDATDGPVAQAAEEIAKAVAGQRFSGGTQSFAKSASSTVAERYVALVKSLPPGAQDALQDAVARAAMRFQFAQGTPGQEAVRLAKSVALDLAASEARRPKPSIENAAAAMTALHARPRTIR